MRESRLSGSEGGVAPMGHPYPYGVAGPFRRHTRRDGHDRRRVEQ